MSFSRHLGERLAAQPFLVSSLFVVGLLAGTGCDNPPPEDDGGAPSVDDDAGSGHATGSTCPAYCERVMASCTGANALYESDEACLSACATFPNNGAEDDAAGNTLQCRYFHAGAAADDPAMHCPHASASGAGVCGSYCEVYCDQVMANCNGAYAAYPDRGACLATCAVMPNDGAYDAASGNNVQCRLFHASAPAAADPMMHCAHASANGGGACGSYCDAYCDQVMTNCTGASSLYADRASCSTACSAFPISSDWATSGDSVQCRTMHGSYPAISDPATHCAHASAAGDGVCVDEEPPAQSITVSGEVHALGAHLANNHIGVGAATVLAYGVAPAASATTSNAAGSVGQYSLTLPANGQIFFAMSKAGHYPTYLAASLGSSNISKHLILTESAWLDNVASTYGVNLTTPFACHAPALSASDQCTYAVALGQILDDGATGAPAPVAGITSSSFTVKGGANRDDWYTMGPYFLSADGTPSASNTSSVTTGTTGGLYALFVEVPQTQAGYDSVSLQVSIAYDDGGMRYFGPEAVTVFRPTGVTWVDIKETGAVPSEPVGEVSFDDQVYPLFLPVSQGGFGCQGCHTNQGGATPAGGLNLQGGADVAYASLDPASYPQRVNLATPSSSLLLKKPLYESSGAQDHPIFAWASADAAAYRVILQWIEEGAVRGVSDEAVSFVNDVRPLLANSTANGGMGCVACHYGSASPFTVDGSAAELYGELVNEAAADLDNSGEGYRINKQGAVGSSLLLTSLLADSGEPHPQKPFYSTADPRYQTFYAWIAGGYLNDEYCADYCADMQATCSGSNQQYPNLQNCLNACDDIPATGSVDDAAGDTIQCRIFHLGAAAADADTHCAHAGATGGGVCQ